MPYLSPLSFNEEQLTISELKQQLEHFAQYQRDEFLNHNPVTDLVLGRAEYMDLLLRRLWQHFGFAEIHDLSLVAVGATAVVNCTRCRTSTFWWCHTTN